MAQRIPLAKSLAPGSQSAGVWLRTGWPPFQVLASSPGSAFDGSVTIQQSVDSITVPDASATWQNLGSITTGNSIRIDVPVYRLRVDGTHTTNPATVILTEEVI